MSLNIKHILFISFSLLVINTGHVIAVTDAELEAIEKQIEQQEVEKKHKAEEKAKRKAEAEQKRKADEEMRRAELERQRKEEEQKRIAEQKRIEEEKGKAEEARLAELERLRQEEEARVKDEKEKKEKYNLFIAEAEQALNNWDKDLAIDKYNEALILNPNDRIAIDGINKAKKLLEKGCYDVIGVWILDDGWIYSTYNFKTDGTQRYTVDKGKWDGTWECLDAGKKIFLSKDSYHYPTKQKIENGKLCYLSKMSMCYERKK